MAPNVTKPTKTLAAFIFSATLLLGCSGMFTPTSAQDPQTDKADKSLTVQDDRQEIDCLEMAEWSRREACFALSEGYKNCPDSDLRCAPYKKMYALDRQLQQINAEIISQSRKQYAAYVENDPSYLDDLEKYLEGSDRAWREFRDSECIFEQFVQGMSRQESANLAEACRAGKTQDRINELKELSLALKD